MARHTFITNDGFWHLKMKQEVERGGGNGLDYNYVVGSVHLQGTLLKTANGNLRSLTFLFPLFPRQLQETCNQRAVTPSNNLNDNISYG